MEPRFVPEPPGGEPHATESQRSPKSRNHSWIVLAGIGFLALLTISATLSNLLGPPVWKWLFGEAPPAVGLEIATLLEVIFAFLALTVAGIGYLLYRIFEVTVENTVNVRWQQVQNDTEEGIDRFRKDLMQTVSSRLSEAEERTKQEAEKRLADALENVAIQYTIASQTYWDR